MYKARAVDVEAKPIGAVIDVEELTIATEELIIAIKELIIAKKVIIVKEDTTNA